MASNNPGPGYRPDPVEDDAIGYGWGWWWWIVLWIILLIIFFGGGWWWGGYRSGYRGNGNGYQQAPQTNNGSRQQNMTQGPMISEDLVDRQITVQGTIAQTWPDMAHAFTLGPAGPGDHSLLVILGGQNKNPSMPKAGEKVTVTGTIHRFARGEVANQTGLNLPANEFDTFGGRLYVLATKVQAETGASGKTH